MAVLSCFDLWKIPLAVLAGCAALFGGFRARMMILAILLVVAIGDGVVSGSIKKIVGRPRPFQVLPGVRTLDLHKSHPRFLALRMPLHREISNPEPGPVTGNSFPSSHAVNNFSAALVIAFFYRRWGWLYFIVAALVAYSRVYVGVHWPSDVLAGIFVGLGVAFLVLAGLELAWRRFGPGWMPRIYARHPGLLETA